MPPVGDILRRLRVCKGLSLRDVAAGAGLSPSFLGAVERGESDISVGRLGRIAEYYEQDLGSLLGYTQRQARPHVLGGDERFLVTRGPGVKYEVFRIPGAALEMLQVELEPFASFASDLSHHGIDAMIVLEGAVTVVIGGFERVVEQGNCATWSGGYPHRLKNDAAVPAKAVGVTSERVF